MNHEKILKPFRKIYQKRFLFRCAVLLMTAVLYFAAPGQFEILSGFDCFKRFSVFHIMWVVWMVDMVLQLIPNLHYWPLGSQKFFKATFQPLKDYMARSDQNLVRFIIKINRDTILIGLVWFILTSAIGILYFTGIFQQRTLLLISVI